MEAEEIIDELTLYGLSALEARVCVSMLKGGKMSVREIAKESGIVRTDVYRIVKRMRENDLVIEHLGRPLLYEVLSPHDLLQVLVKKQENKLRTLVEKQQELRASLNSMSTSRTPINDVNEYFQVVRGVPNIVDKLREITNCTQDELLILNDKQALANHGDHGLLKNIKQAYDRGVKIQILTEDEEKNLEYIKQLSQYAEVRYIDFIPLLMTVCDAKCLFLGSTIQFMRSYKEKRSILTNNVEFVSMTRRNFNVEWENNSIPAIDSPSKI